MTQQEIQRLFTGLRNEGIDSLRELAVRDAAQFLEVVGQILDEAEAAEVDPRAREPVEFIFKQQPGSENQT